MASTYSAGYSSHLSRSNTIVSDVWSTTSESPRARHVDRLRDYAVAAGVPLALPRPMMSDPSRRAMPQNPSDKAGAEEYIMMMRPKKFLVGKSSKSFTGDEVLLALDKAVKDGASPAVVEALLQFAESAGVDASKSTLGASKKGQVIPTFDYIFSQTEHPGKSAYWQLLLSRASQRARDNSLAGALAQKQPEISKVRALLERGANPSLCHDHILELMQSSVLNEDLIETLLLSPLLNDQDFLNTALTRSALRQSLRTTSMLLLRGADVNFNHGEALRTSVSSRCYDIVLAQLILSIRPPSTSVLDECVVAIPHFDSDTQKPLLVALLFAGASGPQTSRSVASFITERDMEVIPVLLETHAFNHGTFPTSKMFLAAVESGDLTLALNIFRQSRSRSLSDCTITGAHLKLVRRYNSQPEETLEVISELLSEGVAGDIASQMLLASCESPQINHPDVDKLLNILVTSGGASVNYDGGKCLLLAIEAKNLSAVAILSAAQATKKILSAGVAHATLKLRDDPVKLEIWSILVDAGASGPVIDQQMVLALNSSQALSEIKVLLLQASLDYADGEFIVKSIREERFDVLQLCLSQKQPVTALPWIWKQTRQMFAIAGNPPYSLSYMQTTLEALHSLKGDAPANDLLLDATKCHSPEVSLSLARQFLAWGASPDHNLGESLVACVKRRDHNTLSALLSVRPNKTSLRYAFEAAMTLDKSVRPGLAKLLLDAGLEASILDATLPKILQENPYDRTTAHLLVDGGARLHRAVAEHLVLPAKALDTNLITALLQGHGLDSGLLVSLQVVMNTHPDWATRKSDSRPLMKTLLSQIPPGPWADTVFLDQISRHHDQDAADLFAGHLTSETTFDQALSALGSTNSPDLSQDQLSLTRYLLGKGATGPSIDETYTLAVRQLKYDWIKVLDPHLTSPETKSSAFSLLQTVDPSSRSSQYHEITNFLLQQGFRGKAVDDAFILAAGDTDLKTMARLLPSVTSADTVSSALEHVTQDILRMATNAGLATIKFLINGGASEASVRNAMKAAASAEAATVTKLVAKIRSSQGIFDAAFSGLMLVQHHLSSVESRAILQMLIQHGLNVEDTKTVARVAAARHDIGLLALIARCKCIDEARAVALATVASSGRDWLSDSGIAFIKPLLALTTDSSIFIQLASTAASSLDLTALRLVLEASIDKADVATHAFASLPSSPTAATSEQALLAIKLLLSEGAKGPAVEQAAAAAAKASNYESLDLFLNSPATASILPAAFGAIARNKANHATSDQLSIASILIKRGISTELLAIAAAEAAKLLDLEALKVLSQSSNFSNVTDETLRTLLLTGDSWHSPQGVNIIQYLLEVGVSQGSKSTTASKAASHLDFDVLKVVITSDPSMPVVKSALGGLIGLSGAWLCPKGLRLMEYLLQQKAPQEEVDTAFIQACQNLDYDGVSLVRPYVKNQALVASGLKAASDTDSKWLSNLHLVKDLLDYGPEGDVLDAMLIKAARALHHEGVKLLSEHVTRAEVYTQAFAASLENPQWRQSLELLDLLLHRGAFGDPVEKAYIAASRHLDYRAVKFLWDHVDNRTVDEMAFTAAAGAESWLAPGNYDLLVLLHSRQLGTSVVAPALIEAAAAHNLPLVTLLSKGSNETGVSQAFEAAVKSGKDWTSETGTEILTVLTGHGAKGKAVEQTLVESATALRSDIVNACCSNLPKSGMPYFSAAFDAVIRSNDNWSVNLDALRILQLMIDRGARGETAAFALVQAAADANAEAVSVLAQAINDPAVYTDAFNVMTVSGPRWLLPSSAELVDFLLARSNTSDTGLHEALINATKEVVQGNALIDVLRLLLMHGANVSYVNEGAQAIQLATAFAREDVLQLLLEYQPDTITIYVAMQEALRSEHDEPTVLSLVELLAGPDSSPARTDAQNAGARSRLLFDSLRYYPDSTRLATFFCDLGALLDATQVCRIYEDEPGFDGVDEASPLLYALHVGASDEVVTKVLLDRQADIEFVAPVTKSNALILAARQDKHNIVATLIDRGARASPQDIFERTPLFYAARNGNTSTITSLLRKKPLVNDGSLHEASRMLFPDAINMLVAAGHDVNFTSIKHDGRNPLCELCFKCQGSDSLVRLHSSLLELQNAKAASLTKCRGRTPLFWAIENEIPVPIVKKLLEICLWREHSDHANVFEQSNHFYSSTMYIKKGLCKRDERTAMRVLTVLEDLNVEDRFYAKERMQQPKDAVGMPQRIADMDHKKWIRSSRLDEEQEDHERKMRREMEEMNQRDQLTTNRHLLTMQHREDVAQQSFSHNDDTHWQTLQFRSREHGQTMRYQDDRMSVRLDDGLATYRMKAGQDSQIRAAQFVYDVNQSSQQLDHLRMQQNTKLEGAQQQQMLRLEGMTTENSIKNDHEMDNLRFGVLRSMQERSDMDFRLQHTGDMNDMKVSTQRRMEDVAQDSREAQLRHQENSDGARLRMESAMNDYRRQNNDETIRKQETMGQLERNLMQDKFQMTDMDRQNQLYSMQAQDHQKLSTLQQQGHIQNTNLVQKGRIENQNLRDKNMALNEGRIDEQHHSTAMGRIRYNNEAALGQIRAENEQTLGQVKVSNEYNMGEAKVYNSAALGRQQVENEDNLGDAKERTFDKIGSAQHRNMEQKRQDLQSQQGDLEGHAARMRAIKAQQAMDAVRAAQAQRAVAAAKQKDAIWAKYVKNHM